MKRRLTQISVLLTLLLCAEAAQADTRVDLTPSIAYFSPTTNVVDQDGVTAKFDNCIMFGGRLSMWLNPRVAVELSGYYGRSSLNGQVLGVGTDSVDLSLFYGSAQVAVALDPNQRLLLHGGLGMQGTNYDEFIDGGNILTGVLGISGVHPLSPSVALRSDLDVHLHTTYFEVGTLRTDELSQVDLVTSVGIQFTPGAKKE